MKPGVGRVIVAIWITLMVGSIGWPLFYSSYARVIQPKRTTLENATFRIRFPWIVMKKNNMLVLRRFDSLLLSTHQTLSVAYIHPALPNSITHESANSFKWADVMRNDYERQHYTAIHQLAVGTGSTRVYCLEGMTLQAQSDYCQTEDERFIVIYSGSPSLFNEVIDIANSRQQQP